MSTETTTPETGTEYEERGALARLRNSPFLSELFSNRLALIGIGIIVGMVAVALYVPTGTVIV